MKALRYILIGLVAAAVAGILAYQALVAKNLTTNDIFRAALILAGLVLSLVKSRKRRPVGNKKTLYQKAYGEFIRNAFSSDPKLEKKFFSAVDDYNQDRPAKGVEKLRKLRGECHNSADIYAVTVFTGLCLDDMGLYEEAASAYENALRIHPSSTLASNLGLCRQRLGNFPGAVEAYEHAIDLDPDNAFVYNNMASLYFREGDYETALDYAEHAIDINPTMPQALSTAAICFALLGDEELYKEHYRRAVAAGYDGKTIKQAIRNLDPTL